MLQEVAVLVDERDDLLKRVDSADSVFHEQHQRFSEVLVLLSKTLAIPDQMLLLLSEPDVHEFTLGLNQVRTRAWLQHLLSGVAVGKGRGGPHQDHTTCLGECLTQVCLQVRAELEDWRDRATRATSEEHQSAGRIAPLLVMLPHCLVSVSH